MMKDEVCKIRKQFPKNTTPATIQSVRTAYTHQTPKHMYASLKVIQAARPWPTHHVCRCRAKRSLGDRREQQPGEKTLSAQENAWINHGTWAGVLHKHYSVI